jgi:hypothetical protein
MKATFSFLLAALMIGFVAGCSSDDVGSQNTNQPDPGAPAMHGPAAGQAAPGSTSSGASHGQR